VAIEALGQFGILIVLWIVVITPTRKPRYVSTYPIAHAPTYPMTYDPKYAPSARSYFQTFWNVFFIWVAHYALDYWVAARTGTLAEAVTGSFASVIWIASSLFLPLTVWGTDVAEVSETLVGELARRVRYNLMSGGLAAITSLALIGIISLDAWLLAPSIHAPLVVGFVCAWMGQLVLGLVIAALSSAGRAVLQWVGNIDQWDSQQSASVPLRGQYLSLLPYFGLVYVVGALQMGLHWNVAIPGPTQGTFVRVLGAFLVGTAIISIVLLASGRKQKWQLIGLYLFLVTLWEIVALLLVLPITAYQNSLLTPATRGLAPAFLDPQRTQLLQVFVAPAALVMLIRTLTRRGSVTGRLHRMALLFRLVVGVETLVVASILLQLGHSLGEQLSALAATLFLGGQLWDLITSGETITNNGSATFPRYARIFLYLGYVLMLAASALVVAAVPTAPELTDLVGHDVGYYPQIGLVLLGIPLLFTSALLTAVRLQRRP
jgi:hypothetical protein